jgi:hypothetical protein
MASNAKALSFLSGDLSLSGTEVSINVAGSVQSDSITGSTITMKNTGSTIVASDGTTAVLSESGGVVTLTADEANVGSNALVVDSSGKVGIGTNSPSQTLTIYNAYDNQIKLQNGANADQSYEFGRNGSNGLLTFYGNQSGFTGYVFDGVDDERMRIDPSGRVGIGTSSPSSYYANHLVVDIGSSVQSGITIVSDTGNQGMFAFADGTSGNARYRGAIDYNHSNDSMAFLAAGAEAMRIDSSGNLLVNGGNLLVNASSFQGGSTVGIQLNATNNASNAYAMLIKNSDGSEIFQFKCNGSASNISGTWGTISDINLKENIIDATNKLSDVLKLKVKNFNFKSDPEKTKYIGFIAQELETIFPNLVEESVDGIKSVKTSILIPILTKAIQEQQALIESQQSQIDTLTVKTQEQDFTIASLISRIEALENA